MKNPVLLGSLIALAILSIAKAADNDKPVNVRRFFFDERGYSPTEPFTLLDCIAENSKQATGGDGSIFTGIKTRIRVTGGQVAYPDADDKGMTGTSVTLLADDRDAEGVKLSRAPLSAKTIPWFRRYNYSNGYRDGRFFYESTQTLTPELVRADCTYRLDVEDSTQGIVLFWRQYKKASGAIALGTPVFEDRITIDLNKRRITKTTSSVSLINSKLWELVFQCVD